MARAVPTNNAVTDAVAANTLIALCMTGSSCVEWPDQTGPATYRLVRCLDVRIATTSSAARGQRTLPISDLMSALGQKRTCILTRLAGSTPAIGIWHVPTALPCMTKTGGWSHDGIVDYFQLFLIRSAVACLRNIGGERTCGLGREGLSSTSLSSSGLSNGPEAGCGCSMNKSACGPSLV